MLRSMYAKFITNDNKNSVAYLALLCLLYFFITSNYTSLSSSPEIQVNSKDNALIEISKDGNSTVRSFSGPSDLKELASRYDLLSIPESGDKIIVDEEQSYITKISGIKRISLGIPIGINSATTGDLQAIPGIGAELAARIIDYRETNGEFNSIDELDNIEGIGSIKLEVIRKTTKID